MSNEIILDDDLFPTIDSIEAVPIAAPVRTPQPTGDRQYRSAPKQTNWQLIAALCALAFFLGSQYQGCDRLSPSPDEDSVVIDESGKFALILQDKSEAGQSRVTSGQATAINSTMTKDVAANAGFTLRILDVNDSTDKVEAIWKTLKDKAADPPSLTVTSNGRMRSGPLPDGVGEIKSALESIK